MGHDLVVIGASAGGIEALSALVAALPDDLAACVCIVQHLSSAHESLLPRILGQAGVLPVTFAAAGDPVTAGRIYIAPPDRHLVVDGGRLEVVMGPRENNFRPAVDPLFRSAALAHRQRVVGVVLSGALDCGTAGLLAIKRCGGVALVQDPDEALVAEMPRNAIDNVPVDAVLPLAAIAGKIVELSRRPARAEPLAGPRLLRFRCRDGHGFGGSALSAEQKNTTEGAFWAALRALEEQAALARRLATRARELGQTRSVSMFEERAVAAEHQARVVREELLKRLAPRDDAEATGERTNSVKH